MKTRSNRVWKEEMIFKVYDLARSGLPEAKIAKALGMSPKTFMGWKSKRRLLRYALKQGYARSDEHGNSAANFAEYVYNRLSPHLQDVWDRIMEVDKLKTPNGIVAIESMLKDIGKNGRQHLFLHALVASAFNQSEACRMTNIPKKTVEAWITNDVDFADLVTEMHEHKKNFFDECLVRLCAAGDTAATIFANRTMNRDRYNDKQELEINGRIEHHHTIDIDELDLPLNLRRIVLEKMREKKPELIETTAEEIL